MPRCVMLEQFPPQPRSASWTWTCYSTGAPRGRTAISAPSRHRSKASCHACGFSPTARPLFGNGRQWPPPQPSPCPDKLVFVAVTASDTRDERPQKPQWTSELAWPTQNTMLFAAPPYPIARRCSCGIAPAPARAGDENAHHIVSSVDDALRRSTPAFGIGFPMVGSMASKKPARGHVH